MYGFDFDSCGNGSVSEQLGVVEQPLGAAGDQQQLRQSSEVGLELIYEAHHRGREGLLGFAALQHCTDCKIAAGGVTSSSDSIGLDPCFSSHWFF
ncbi:hypothetical protein ACH47B_31875 [Rhodococcus sp. NPDC019627]